MRKDRIYKFRLRLIPELAFFDSVTAAEEAWKKAKTVRPIWMFWLLLIGIAVPIGLASVVIRRLFALPEWVQTFITPMFAGAACTLVVSYFGYYFWRKPMQGVVRENLQAAGIPICLKCGYDLRGQEIARSPECGEPFDEKLLPTTAAVDTKPTDEVTQDANRSHR